MAEKQKCRLVEMGYSWKPGTSGNPKGRKPLPPEVKELRKELTLEAAKSIFNVLTMSPTDLKEVIARGKKGNATNFEVAAAQIMIKAISSGDIAAFSMLLDRVLGKPHTSVVVEDDASRRRSWEDILASSWGLAKEREQKQVESK